MNEDFIKVLWIEDDPIVTEAYPLEAEDYGLALHPYCCWDDAKVALEKEFDTWEAIILDAKCKQHRDSADNATKFLSEALSGLRALYAKNHRTINWYILSGGSEEELNDSILDDRKAWDSDWPKLYYSKSTDRETLFQRIHKQTKKRPNATQIKTVYFRDVFDAIRESGLSKKVESHMLNLLEPVIYPNCVSSKDYNYRMKDARITIEYIIRRMIDMGVLPPEYGNKENKKGAINVSNACNYISKCNTFPKLFSKTLKNINYVVGETVHGTHGFRFSPGYIDYNKATGYTPYLLKSYALQLCDAILWLNQFIIDHPDTEENAKKRLEWESSNNPQNDKGRESF